MSFRRDGHLIIQQELERLERKGKMASKHVTSDIQSTYIVAPLFNLNLNFLLLFVLRV